jgi:hypothetical protein
MMFGWTIVLVMVLAVLHVPCSNLALHLLDVLPSQIGLVLHPHDPFLNNNDLQSLWVSVSSCFVLIFIYSSCWMLSEPRSDVIHLVFVVLMLILHLWDVTKKR